MNENTINKMIEENKEKFVIVMDGHYGVQVSPQKLYEENKKLREELFNLKLNQTKKDEFKADLIKLLQDEKRWV